METEILLNGKEKCIVLDNAVAATQLLVPFLHAHNGGIPVKYIETINDFRSIVQEKFYENSKIILEKGSLPCKNHFHFGIELSINMTKKENMVINLSSASIDYVIQTIGENEDLADVYWFITVDTTKESCIQALTEYNSILKIYENTVEKYTPEIIFLLKIRNKLKDVGDYDFAYIFETEKFTSDFVLKDRIGSNFKSIFWTTPCDLNISTLEKVLYLELTKKGEDYASSINESFAQLLEFVRPKI